MNKLITILAVALSGILISFSCFAIAPYQKRATKWDTLTAKEKKKVKWALKTDMPGHKLIIKKPITRVVAIYNKDGENYNRKDKTESRHSSVEAIKAYHTNRNNPAALIIVREQSATEEEFDVFAWDIASQGYKQLRFSYNTANAADSEAQTKIALNAPNRQVVIYDFPTHLTKKYKIRGKRGEHSYTDLNVLRREKLAEHMEAKDGMLIFSHYAKDKYGTYGGVFWVYALDPVGVNGDGTLAWRTLHSQLRGRRL